jgi:hypothetical protein
MRLTKVTGLPTWIYVTCGLEKTQFIPHGLGSTVVVLLLTAHDVWTRGCSHFTTVFGHAAPLNFIAAIVPPGNTSTPSVLRQLGAVWERSNLLERGTACILPGTSARYVFADMSVVYLSWQCSFKGCGSGCCFCGEPCCLCSASARHNRTIRTHRSSCCLWPSTCAFAVCVTVLARTTIALRSSRCTTSQCTLDSPRITYIIICSPRVRTTEGGDHVRMTGHVRAGMGHRELVSDWELWTTYPTNFYLYGLCSFSHEQLIHTYVVIFVLYA